MTTYRVVISREDPWWVAVAYGDGLPEHGVATETRNIASLEGSIRDLIVLRTDADLRMPYEEAVRHFELEMDYNGLPGEAAKALYDYFESGRKLQEAKEQHAENMQRAASVLAGQTHASVRDIAGLMKISFQRVSQLLAGLRGKVPR